MKIAAKLLVISLFAIPSAGIATSIGVSMAKQKESLDAETSISGRTATLKAGDTVLSLNTKDLHFEISKGNATFDSGLTLETDEEITSLRAGFLESAVSLSALNSSGGESSFAMFDANHRATTKVSVEEEPNGLVAHCSVLDGKKASPSLALAFDIHYALEEDGFSLSLDNIVDQGSSNVLSSITLYPGFDMTYGNVTGTYLIPDGSGALIDCATPTHAQSPLSLRAYGRDMGLGASSRTITSSEQLSWPMFGYYNAEKAMMVTVEEGQEYCELNAKRASMSDNYNTAYFRFIVRDVTYQYLGLSDSSRKSIPQEKPNLFTPRLHYHLYDQALDYGGLASKYRDYLLANELLPEGASSSKLRLEFLMADSKKALFGKSLVPMTSTRFIEEQVASIANGRERLSVSLKGYTRGGYENSYPDSFPVEGSLGDFGTLGNRMKEKGIDLSYRVDSCRSFVDTRGDLARNAAQKHILTSDYVDGTKQTFYRLNPDAVRSKVRSFASDIQGLHGVGADFTSIGYDLYSTYYQSPCSRSVAIASFREALGSFPLKRNIRKPNLYALPYADAIIDAPLSSSSFLIETESIPFQAMVLGANTTLYSPALNLFELGSNGTLGLIDYRINPSYLLTEQSAMDLIDSPASSYVYSSKFETWKEEALASYDKVVATLSKVDGLLFLARRKIGQGVYENTYEGDKKIVINYSSSPYDYHGTTIEAKSAEVIYE